MKKPALDKGQRFSIKEEIEDVFPIDYPVFCFKHLQRDYHLNKCTADEKKCLIEQIVLLSQKTWDEIQLSPRHGSGSEKIDIKSIKAPLPMSFTEDVKHLLALRFDGKKAFVGFRHKFIFHIFYIDRDFTLYNH
ncbi:MAG: hypothetical protein LBQ65_00660 [Tannerellaceae bacterium]|nr:hypothetical protein [Tannerellaceae bacterium]